MLERLKKYREMRARVAREKAAEAARIEAERLQTERASLMTSSDKELMVEAIMELRGLRERQDALTETVASLREEVSSLHWGLDALKSE
jgi:hypothetical protein